VGVLGFQITLKGWRLNYLNSPSIIEGCHVTNDHGLVVPMVKGMGGETHDGKLPNLHQ
jgi:hypothetical protein